MRVGQGGRGVVRKVVCLVSLALVASGCYRAFDFNGDNKAELYFVDTAMGDWYRLNPAPDPPTLLYTATTPYGEQYVPGDYDGNGNDEIATITAAGWTSHASGTSIAWPSPARTGNSYQYVDVVPGDYNGDHKTDPAYYRESDATWFIYGKSPITFGTPPTDMSSTGIDGRDQDVPVPADYDGDGTTDLATWNPRTFVWQYRSSKTGTVSSVAFGSPYSYPAPADYNGDHKADRATLGWNTGIWTIEGVGTVNVPPATSLGVPAVADFDGDGKADLSWADLPTSSGGQPTPWHIRASSDQSVTDLTIPAGSSYRFPVMVDDNLIINTARLTLVFRCQVQGQYC